MTEAFF